MNTFLKPKFKNRLFVLFVLGLTFSSCKNFNASEFDDVKVSGSIGIGENHQNNEVYLNQGGDLSYAIFRDKNEIPIKGALTINSKTYSFDENVQTFHGNGIKCFGDSLSVSFQDTKANILFKDQFYVPNTIHFDGLDSNEIIVGNWMTWNTDENNKDGVTLIISCDRLFQSDSIHEKLEGGDFNKYLHFKDNGKLKITAKMLEGLPKGARVSVSLSRGTERLIHATNGLDYGVLVNTSTQQSYVIYK